VVGQGQPPVPAQASIFDGFSFTYGDKKITGWHAAGVIAAGLAVWTLLQVYGTVSTQAAWNAYAQAPPCAAANVNDSCKARVWVNLTLYMNGSSDCTIYARPVLLANGSGDWSGLFAKTDCDTMKRMRFTFGEIWLGQLVSIESGNTDYWSTDSLVGQHLKAGSGVLTVLAIDAIFALLIALATISFLVKRRKRAAG